MTRDGQAGFSLVEILVVLSLLAVMASVSLVSFSASDRAARPETEAILLANRLSLASDEAMVTGNQLSLTLDATGYGVDVWSSEGNDWIEHPSGLIGLHHELPGGVNMEVEERLERVAIRPDATGEPVIVTFSDSNGSWRVSHDGLSARALLHWPSKRMMLKTMASDNGFTVVEALVAMSILAISAVALIGVSESQIGRIDGLENRAIGLWVAENHLAELELLGLSESEAPQTVTMLGRDWSIDVAVEETSDPALAEVRISVVEAGLSTPVSVLGGFIDVMDGPP